MPDKPTYNHIPALRFPDFVNDGEWEDYSIEEVFDIRNGYTPSKSKSEYWENGSIPWFRMEDIRANGNILSDSIQHITPEAIKGFGLFPAYSIIVATSATIGEHALITVESLANQRFTYLSKKKPFENRVDMLYFHYYMFVIDEWCKKNTNTGGFLSVNMSAFRQLRIPIPPLAEQQRIAACLSAVDEMINAANGKLEQLKAYKKGLMQKLFPAKGKKLPELRFKEFEKDGEWVEKELGMAAKVKSGYAFRSNTYTQTGKYRIVTISNVKNGYLDLTSNNFLEHLPEDIQPHQILQKGDILVSMTGNVGRVCKVCCDNCLLNQRVGLVDVYSSDVDRDFIYTILTSERFEKSMIENGQGAAQANIGNKDIEGYCFFCPPTPPEQRKIADSFTSIDEMINQYTNKVVFLELYKKGLMQQLFPTSK